MAFGRPPIPTTTSSAPTPGALLSVQGPRSPDQTVNTQPFNADSFISCVGTQARKMRRYTCIGEPKLFPTLFICNFSLLLLMMLFCRMYCLSFLNVFL